jgi:UDP-glucose 4-epimerase
MKTVIVTGSQGFIGTYICAELLNRGYRVVGYDDYSKYGRVVRPHDNHPNFIFHEMNLEEEIPAFEDYKPTYIILGAAKIGGISYFHKYAFDLIMSNEAILWASYKSILKCPKDVLKRVVTISSSMVYEGADVEKAKLSDFASMNCCGPGNFCVDPNSVWPTKESSLSDLPIPTSTYGAQKLMCEYWAQGASEQYNVPFTIVRPFNAVGAYEDKALGESDVISGNVKLQMSHVLPDLINKCLKGQDPLHILGDGSQVRCYTNGRDIARGIVMAMESELGLNESFNISTPTPHTVLELAALVWGKINPDKPFRWKEDKPFEHDVQKRLPDVSKAKSLLGFEAQVGLEDSITEVIEWMKVNGH